MAEQFDQLSQKLIDFVNRQHMFFVGTAGVEGKINVSPKGMDTLRVLNPHEIVWLNLTGSGNETAAHVLENRRMTVMLCSFDKEPLILRIYGTAEIIHPRDADDWAEYSTLFNQQPGARQYFKLNIDMVQTSCGFAVPHYEMTGERETLAKWALNKGDNLRDYWEEKNQLSLDGKSTRILDE